MNIYVLVKQVPDTETRIKTSGTGIDENGIKWIVSPFDEHALEEALRQKEKTSATVTAVSFGPGRAAEALRTAYALGVDNAIHIQDDSYNVFDVGFAAASLAKFLKDADANVILAGHIAIDSQSSMVPAMIAEHLGCANINNAVELTIEGDKVKVRREIEGGLATMESASPVVITAAKNLNDPRYPSLKGIMASKKKKIEVKAASELGVDAPHVEVVGMEPPPPRPPGRIIEADSPQAKAAELAKLLKDEAKVL
ncbi:MAG: electron transfer flavoprotein subunit beta/FixA family protein [Leptospiraceae bacterium]|nr:electron transfer flavoprotein subunit beta/FixA family protein [Leptospiraceae bacterium]